MNSQTYDPKYGARLKQANMNWLICFWMTTACSLNFPLLSVKNEQISVKNVETDLTQPCVGQSAPPPNS